MKTFLKILAAFTVLSILLNPSLEKGKREFTTMGTNFLMDKLSFGLIDVSLCRENHIFYSTFYVSPNVNAFNHKIQLKGCVPKFYGFFGFFFPISKENQGDYKNADGELNDCPGDCEPVGD